MAEKVILCGYVQKQGKSRNKWRYRWISLNSDKELVYKKRKDSEKIQGKIDLTTVSNVRCDVETYPEPFAFQIPTKNGRTYAFLADNKMDWANWIKAISSVLGTRTDIRPKSPLTSVRVASPQTTTPSTHVTTPVKALVSTTPSSIKIVSARITPTAIVSSSQKKSLVKTTSSARAKPSPAAVRTGVAYRLPEEYQVSLHDLNRYCRWIDSLNVWKPLTSSNSSNGNDDDDDNITKILARECRSGLLLCRVMTRLSSPSEVKRILKQLHDKPNSRSSATSNIQKALHLLFLHAPRSRFVPTPDDIYDGDTNKISLLIREMCHVCAIKDAWQSSKETLLWFHNILTCFDREPPINNDFTSLYEFFRDGVAFACVLFWLGGSNGVPERGLPSVDLSRLYVSRNRLRLRHIRSNIRYVFELLRDAGVELIWTCDEFLSFPDDDFFMLQLQNIKKQFCFSEGFAKGSSGNRTFPCALPNLTETDVSKGIVGLYFNDETMTTRVRNLVFRDPSSTAEKTQRTLEFRVRELDEEEEEDSKKAKPSPSLKRTKKPTRSEIRARVERERKERLVKKMRSVGIVSPSLNNSNITINLKNKKSITADINETTRARLVDVQREVIEMEEEIARLENNNQMDFRMELETVSRKAELDALKNERDTLIAQLKEQRALMRNEFEDNVRKEKQHMKKMRDLENEQVQKWEQELTRRESESEREREIWESERFEMVKQERLRWEQQLKDRDDEIRKMRLEFQKWQEEMRLRVDEDKRKWMQEHEKRLETFEKRMRDVFEMDKMEALKQYESEREIEFKKWDTEFGKRKQKSQEEWEKQHQRLEKERERHVKEEEARLRDAKRNEIEALIYRKERRLMTFEETRQNAVRSEREAKIQEIKSKDDVELRAIVRWLAVPKMVSLVLRSGKRVPCVMLAMMRVISEGKLLPAKNLNDALVLRWTDSSQNELGRVAVASISLSSCDEVSTVVSIQHRGDSEALKFEFSDRGEAMWYVKGLERVRVWENTF